MSSLISLRSCSNSIFAEPVSSIECTGTNCDAKTETADHQNVYTVTGKSYPAQSTQTCSVCSYAGAVRNTENGSRS